MGQYEEMKNKKGRGVEGETVRGWVWQGMEGDEEGPYVTKAMKHIPPRASDVAKASDFAKVYDDFAGKLKEQMERRLTVVQGERKR
ncbi:hypothetical protein NQZ68_004572, partial [Dissostichus eleginoides]